MNRPRVRIGPLELDNLLWDEALDRVEALVAARRGGYATTPNVDHLVTAHRDEEFRRIVKSADLVFADGQPLIWVSRLLGTPLVGKITGSDFIGRFAPRAAARGFRVFFMGGRPGAAEATGRFLELNYPGFQNAGSHCPPLGFEHDPRQNREAVRAIRSAAPDLVFVGLGAPKQEKWIWNNRDAYAPAFSFPVGVSFDFIAGFVKRAPCWMRDIGLEWFWRLCQEPKKLAGRYLVRDVQFLPIVIRQMMGK